MKKVLKILTVLSVFIFTQTASALGFSIRGAFQYNITSNTFGLEGEAEYSEKINQQITWGVRASVLANPLNSAVVLLVPNAYLQYRDTIYTDKTTSAAAYGKLELGLGVLPQIFPRAVATIGLDVGTPLTDSINGFAQAKIGFDFIITNRAKLLAEGRVGAIIIPFVPYLGASYAFDFYPNAGTPKVFLGSLMYLSRQFFIGLEAGIEPDFYARLFFQFEER